MDVNNKAPALREWSIISYPSSLVQSFLNMVFNRSRTRKYQVSRDEGSVPKTSLDVVSHIQELEQLVKKSGVDEESRRTALKATQNLMRTLERPEEVVMRQAFEASTHHQAISAVLT